MAVKHCSWRVNIDRTLFNEQRYTMKSERMGGDDKLYVDPVSIPVNYDYVYVNDVQ